MLNTKNKYRSVTISDRAVLIFCVQHTGIKSVKPAAHIDKVYAETLKEAQAAGVEIIAAETGFDLLSGEIKIIGQLPVIIE